MNLFDQVEELISKGELIEAERLLLEAPVSNTDDQIRKKLLLGEVLLNQDRWSESIDLLEGVLPYANREQLSDALYSLVLNYTRNELPRGAIYYG